MEPAEIRQNDCFVINIKLTFSIAKVIKQAQLRAAKETNEGKITLTKKPKRRLANDVTMMSQLKTCYYVKHVYWKLFRHWRVFIWYTNYHDS